MKEKTPRLYFVEEPAEKKAGQKPSQRRLKERKSVRQGSAGQPARLGSKLKTEEEKAAQKAYQLRFGKAEITVDEISRMSKAQKQEMYARALAANASQTLANQEDTDENAGVQSMEAAKEASDLGNDWSNRSRYSRKLKANKRAAKLKHSTDRYRKVIYRCNQKYNGEKCQTPHVTEDEVKAAFVSAYNQLVAAKKEIIANAEIIRKTLCVTDSLQKEKGKLEEEMAVLVEMTQNIVAENARVAQDQEEYQKRYDGLVQRYDTAKARYDEVVAAISAKDAQNERLANFIKVLKAQDGTISEFDGSLWGSMVEFVTVGRDKEITVTFRDGTEIQV